MMSRVGALCIALAFSGLLLADDSKPVALITDLTPIEGGSPEYGVLHSAAVDLDNATLSGVEGAQKVVRTFFQSAGEPVPAKGFS
jgi:hypothetical protein